MKPSRGPLAVLDLDLGQLPHALIGLDRYGGALALLRLDGVPAGQALLPLDGPVISREALLARVLGAADTAFWEAAVRHWLGVAAVRPPAPAVSLSATVAVCTRERPDDLRRCLSAIARLPDDGQEVLVVDNNPASDRTRRLVEAFPRVRYVREDRPGLDAARNAALREAQGAIIAFTDDDAAPDPGWLRALLRGFDDDAVLCVMGLVLPFELETPAQQWFQRLGGFGRGLRRRVLDGGRHDPFRGWEAGAGVSMALRRDVPALVGPFDEALDVGTPTAGGGDSDILRRILDAGFRIVYDPAALSWHLHRREWRQLRRQLYGYDSAGMAIFTRALLREGDLSAPLRALRWLYHETRNLVAALIRRPGHPPPDLNIARMWGAVVGPWAYLWGRARLLWAGSGEASRPILPAPAEPAVDAVVDTWPTQPPEITVVIPTHDRARSLLRTLTALARQDVRPGAFEVVVVADGCTDDTEAAVRAASFPFRIRVLMQAAAGAGAARNAGAAVAEAPLLLFVDDDVEPLERLVSAHLEAHRRGEADVLLGPYHPVATVRGWLSARTRAWWSVHFEALAEPGHRWSFLDVVTGNLSLSSALFEDVGGFAPALSGYGLEDSELGYRLIRAGALLGYVAGARAIHHDHEGASIERTLRRARQEGRAAAILAGMHPELGAAWPAGLVEGRSGGLLRRFVARSPRSAEGALEAVGVGMRLFERTGMRREWDRALGTGRAIARLLGALEVAGSRHALERLFRRSAADAEDAPRWEPSQSGDGEGPSARERGRADVRLARDRPDLRDRLPLARYERPFGVRGRILYTLVFRWPRVGASLASWLEWAPRPLRPRRLLTTLRYFQGVADEIATPAALGTMVRSAVSAEESTDIDLDIASGFERAEAALDEAAPASARILCGGQLVARIAAAPGAEPLRGAHLRPFRARRAAPSLIEAWILQDRVPGTSPRHRAALHAAHLQRAPWWYRTDVVSMWGEQYAQWGRMEQAGRAASVVGAPAAVDPETRPWRDGEDEPPAVPATMLAYDELSLLRWLTGRYFRGRGTIVDGGCFLGGSTVALAVGLSENEIVPPVMKHIHAYDRFVVEPYMLEDYATTPGAGPGDSFLEQYEANIAPWRHMVHVHAGDLLEQRWGGGPIEILFVDIAKTPALNDHIVREFLPRLIPVHGILVQQDYVHEWLPWIHIAMERLADHFELLDLYWGGSAVFRLTRPLPDWLADYETKSLAPESQIELMDRSIARLPERLRPVIELARVRLLADLGFIAEAVTALAAIEPANADDKPRIARGIAAMTDYMGHSAVSESRT